MRHELEKYVAELNRIVNNFYNSASKNDPVDGEDIYIRALKAVASDLYKILEAVE